MGKTPRRLARNKVFLLIRSAILRPLADAAYSSESILTEPLEARQMLSASPAAARKALSKLDSNLLSAYDQYLQFSAAQSAVKKNGHLPQSATTFTPSDAVLHTQNGSVRIQAYATPGDTHILAQQLRGYGSQYVTINSSEVDALIPVGDLGKLARLASLRFAQPTAYSVNTGTANSQGDAVILGPSARSSYNVSGAGIKVGILSDSFNNDPNVSDHYSNDVASGDLPGPPYVTDLSDNNPGTDEGRAMAQVIYDTAPGVSFAFASGGSSYQTAASYVKTLAFDGAKVIVDDLTYPTEPFFEDDILSQNETTVVSQGVDYITAAGNFGQNSYSSTWRAGTFYQPSSFSNASGATPFYGGTSFNFNASGSSNDRQNFTLAAGKSIEISFQWDQPYASVSPLSGGCQNQVDAYVLSGNQIVGGSANVTLNKDPIQFFSFTNPSSTTSNTYSLMLVSESGYAVPGTVKYIEFDAQATGWTFASSGANASTIFGHANAAGVESVGAASYSFTNGHPQLEKSSSGGGTPILFNSSNNAALYTPAVTRQGPAIVGPDNVYTTFFVSPGTVQGSNPYPSFTGTSAAAAAVAGVAALIAQKNPQLKPADINNVIASTAITMQTPVPSLLTGYGFLQAYPALSQTVGNVTGTVFSDNNNSGFQDAGEPGIGGVTVYIDLYNNGAIQSGDPYVTTNSAGVFNFYNQPSGTATIRVVSPVGYVALGGGKMITIAGNNTSSGVNIPLFPDAYAATTTGTNYTLQIDTAKPANFDVLINNTLTYTAPIASVPALSFSFRADNGSLTVNFANGNPVPSGGITDDSLSTFSNVGLTINGTAANDTCDISNPTTTFDGSGIVVSNINTEVINGGSGNDTFSITTAQPATQSLTFNGGIGNDSLTVNDVLPFNGSTTVFNAGTNTLDQNKLTVNAGVWTFAGNPAAQSANLAVNLGTTTATLTDANASSTTISVFGTVVFSAGQLGSGINQRNIAALNVGYGDSVIVASPPSHGDRQVLVATSVNISSGGFDVNSNAVSGGIVNLDANDMIITNGSLGTIEPFLTRGYNGGNWNGAGGIQSSAAAADPTYLTGLGSFQNNGSFSSFDGVGNITNAVLIKYTYYGDANLSGTVDGSDYSRVDSGFLTNATGWANGDLNYDGTVDGSDYTLLDNAFNTQGPGL